jgi:hypothetical protein
VTVLLFVLLSAAEVTSEPPSSSYPCSIHGLSLFPRCPNPPPPPPTHCEIPAIVRPSERERKWRIDTDDEKEYFCVAVECKLHQAWRGNEDGTAARGWGRMSVPPVQKRCMQFILQVRRGCRWLQCRNTVCSLYCRRCRVAPVQKHCM